MAVRIKVGVSMGYCGGFFTKISKVPKIIVMHGDTVRCTQNTFLRFLMGPILHFRPFKHADLRVVDCVQNAIQAVPPDIRKKKALEKIFYFF